jgi:hypothetical protein
MLSCCDIETDRMQAHRAALPTPEPRRSRLAGLFDALFRHAGAYPVDHMYVLPRERNSHGIELPPPAAAAPECCCCAAPS